MNKLSLILLLALASCKKEGEVRKTVDGTTTNDFSRLYSKMYNIASIDTSNSKTVNITTLDMPDHKTPFYGIGHNKYEAYSGDNPGFSTKIILNGTTFDPVVQQQYITFVLPRYPEVASAHTPTSAGPIGIARNGVVFFGQEESEEYAIGDKEMNNVDQHLGHPTAIGGLYHYHFEPKYLTANYGLMGFMGFLLDGFPVYGPYENGEMVKQSALDNHNGHVGSTVDYPNDKIYHYHVITASSAKPSTLKQSAPYINGGKYYGTRGEVK